jgi:hypothetical protein
MKGDPAIVCGNPFEGLTDILMRLPSQILMRLAPLNSLKSACEASFRYLQSTPWISETAPDGYGKKKQRCMDEE